MSEKTKPEIVVFAGPNGSEKSDYTETLRPIHLEYINRQILLSFERLTKTGVIFKCKRV